MTSSIGKNKKVGVRVVDERPSATLGRRGIGGTTGAKITTAQDLSEVVKKKVFEGLINMGFAPVNYRLQKEPRLTIEIRFLDYSTSAGFWTGKVQIRGAIKAIAAKKGDMYDKMYRVEKEETIMAVPGAERNERMINDVLSDVLAKLFNDVDLFEFLAS
jgi:uncharacterized lipoprotein YajG